VSACSVIPPSAEISPGRSLSPRCRLPAISCRRKAPTAMRKTMQTRSGGVSTLRSFSLGSPLPFYQASRRELSATPTAPNHALAGARCSAIRDLETALCANAAPAAARPVRSLGRSSSHARLFLLIFCRARSCLLRPGKQKGSPDCPAGPAGSLRLARRGTRSTGRDRRPGSHPGTLPIAAMRTPSPGRNG